MAENFEARIEQMFAEAEKRRLAESGGGTADADTSGQKLDPPDPNDRPRPRGLEIELDPDSEEALADQSWATEWGRNEKSFVLYPTFQGERCGILAGGFVAKKDDTTGSVDRYIRLGNVEVNPTLRQPAIRKKGIGSALLTDMEDYAKRFGATRIVGDISADDLKETPSLIRFYEKRGYTITPTENPAMNGYRFVKSLNQPSNPTNS